MSVVIYGVNLCTDVNEVSETHAHQVQHMMSSAQLWIE